jgi:hypothetical protein
MRRRRAGHGSGYQCSPEPWAQARILLCSRHCSATSVVSDSGSQTGAASRAHVWPDAVSLTAHSAPTSAYSSHQVRYSNVHAVRDEEVTGSNPGSQSLRRKVRSLFVISFTAGRGSSRAPAAGCQRRLQPAQVTSLGEEIDFRRDTFLPHKV